MSSLKIFSVHRGFADGSWISAVVMVAALLPGAGAAPSPLTPAQELATFHLADDQLRVELVAAEPDVMSPVAIAWDADGRLFVAEMSDYPNAPVKGRIKLLEDRDGDGKYERATIFADNLPFPNGVLPWNGGVLVTAAPNIWFFKDTKGDGRADEKRVLFTGFAEGNQQLRVNGLNWGLDNWVYGANGRSDGEVRPGDKPDAPPISLRGHDFRFRPDTGEFEAIAGRSQFGAARDDWGNRFLSWNTIPIRHEVIPERYLTRNPNLSATESLANLLPPGDAEQVFPLTPPPLTFNDESVHNFNALAGLTIYRGDALGKTYRGNAFVGEALLNLVHRRALDPDGATFVARRGEEGKEFLASADPWFHPVFHTTGPDGALYIVDFYRRFVEHPDFVHAAGAKSGMPWREGAEHGRIWRVRSNLFPPQTSAVKLSRASGAELVRLLSHENGWWRDTAQRLLVERKDRSTIPALQTLARNGSAPLARVHTLWTLENGGRSGGQNSLDRGSLLSALRAPFPGVRANAVRLAESRLGAETEVETAVLKLAGDTDPRVRLQVALALGGETNVARKLPAMTRLARRDGTDPWISLALLSSAGPRPWPLLQKLLNDDAQWRNSPTEKQAQFLERLAALVGASQNEADLAGFLAWLNPAMPPATTLPLLAGLADGLAKVNQSLQQLVRNPPAALRSHTNNLNQLFIADGNTASAEQADARLRLAAIRLLARAEPSIAGKILLALLLPAQPVEIQLAAARALMESGDAGLATATLAGWNRYSRTTRGQLLSGATLSAPATTALLTALEQGNILPVEVDATTRSALRRIPDAALKQRADTVLRQTIANDREQVVRGFLPALQLAGEPRRGAELFTKTCVVCHSIQGRGGHVGPDLSGIASRPKEALLADIFDPSRQVSPDFVSYTLMTSQGQTLTGFIAAETPTSITLRRPNEPDETVLRSQTKDMRAEGKSLMPEGLEQGLAPQDVADLLEFLHHPDAQLLPEVK